MSVLERVLQSLSGNSNYEISKQLVFQKVIGVRGLSSGVGVSTVVQNLAYYYSKKKNMRVCVIDTSFLNPIQHVLLGADKTKRDLLDYSGSVDQIAHHIAKTKLKNVSLVTTVDRTIIDMIEKDDAKAPLKLLHDLKLLFDVIIIDLSSEPTTLVTELAIKCNKIISVADQTAKCIYHVKDTLNRYATLAVPLEKMKLCMLNKTVEGVKTSTVQSLEGAGLQVIGQIPYNKEVARLGITGDVVMAFGGETEGFFQFERIITLIAESVLDRTPLNEEHHREKYEGELIKDKTADVAKQHKKKKKGLLGALKKDKAQEQVKTTVQPISKEEHEEELDTFDLDLDVETVEIRAEEYITGVSEPPTLSQPIKEKPVEPKREQSINTGLNFNLAEEENLPKVESRNTSNSNTKKEEDEFELF